MPRLKLPQRVDFSQVVQQLNARGVSQRSIARQLHVQPSTVNRWLHDLVEPSHSHGVGLLFLAEQQQSAPQAKATDAPRTRSILTLLGNRAGEK